MFCSRNVVVNGNVVNVNVVVVLRRKTLQNEEICCKFNCSN